MSALTVIPANTIIGALLEVYILNIDEKCKKEVAI